MSSKYVSKSVTFNKHSEQQMKIWKWCKDETNDFKNQNFADFIREKLEWCINHEGGGSFVPVEQPKHQTGWSSLLGG
ncbi:hypothetical protein PU629_07395 [Pullulanibacillus sp. KACC 23026]|uniref:hypothetical protein n=1 Tax=Pullulanibacillus sp. KACC 23026 TaxID=3028315 RepID=UPI0023B18425|nr:hypothetical protein [Pullulanibacillus sp. KACC 23026]WEG14182.1 hypothetical protein PU629_07395 [Pullulanibacillus sp. KACC 23026]